MPRFEMFKDALYHGGTLAHELGHSLGAKHRLDRDLTGRFGTQSYAAEELVAEMFASFVMADLGLASHPRADHAAYIASWIALLKSDSKAIFTAASKAQAACDYVHAAMGRTVAQEDGGDETESSEAVPIAA